MLHTIAWKHRCLTFRHNDNLPSVKLERRCLHSRGTCIVKIQTPKHSDRATYPGPYIIATFEATEAAASVVFRTVASMKAVLLRPFLANVNEFTFTFTICYRLSVYLSSVTFVRPTQAVQIFGNISTALGTLAIH